MAIFGFLSRGDLEVIPEKLQYAPGDTINGKVTLKLKKPVQANKISIQLMAVRKQYVYDNQIKGEREIINTVFNFTLPLAGAQEYSEGEYPFQIKIPSDAGAQSDHKPNSDTFAGKVYDVVSAIGTVTGNVASPMEWYLGAQLDIPDALDMRKQIQINVG